MSDRQLRVGGFWFNVAIDRVYVGLGLEIIKFKHKQNRILSAGFCYAFILGG